MRIKPWVVLGCTAICAGVGLATIVTTHDPYTAPVAIQWMFWAALFLLVWGGTAAFFSMAGQRLAYALSNGVFWAAGLLSLGLLARRGLSGARLSGGIIGATILLSFFLWLYGHRRHITHE